MLNAIGIIVAIVVGLVGLLATLIGGIRYALKVFNKVENNLILNTKVLNDLVEEVKSFKHIEKRVTECETEIKLINQRCDLTNGRSKDDERDKEKT